LIIGVANDPPFVIKGEGDWDGIGVQLWRQIAEALTYEYRFVEVAADEIATKIQDGTIDLALAAIATAGDEEIVDFSQSYYTTYIGFAERPDRSVWQVVRAVLSPTFLQIALWLGVLLAVVGLLIWLFERQHNDEMFGSGPHGIGAGFWWAAVTMSTIGYGDKVPKTVGGRILALLWMLIAMGITASLTATITSVLALNTGFQSITFPDDLRAMAVGAVDGSPAAELLASERIQFEEADTPEAGLAHLRDGELEILVDTEASLRYVNSQYYKGAMRVQATPQNPRHYAFAFAETSLYYEEINQRLLLEISENDWARLVNRYIPE
jgi:ABC-type amino acid transport substrate-binding protein